MAIRGNFDDAQSGVKKIFSDKDAVAFLDGNGHFFSSANSINWGRLAPQIVYYVSAYCDLLNNGTIKYGDLINVCVPTGNFGNIFAAYLAKLMGLPIGKLICASNKNNILTDFLRTGVYDRNRDFHLTMSPSMDILISSNLERLLAFTAGKDECAKYMDSLSSTGAYEVSDSVRAKIGENFKGYYANEEETSATIRKYYDDYGYLSDTHTAVALCSADKYIAESGDVTPMVVASTASPYKFAADVCKSLGMEKPADDMDALDMLSEFSGTEISYPLRGLSEREVRFTRVINADEMLDVVKEYVK
jgi:threonine synthase